jgi:hypothetical protein
MISRIVSVGAAITRNATPVVLVLGACLAGMNPATANDVDSRTTSWKLSGDLRAGYTASWRKPRAGQRSSDDNARARLRVRLTGDFGNHWQFSSRVGGSYASDQDGFDAYIRSYRPTGTAVNPGDTTVDEFFLGYASPHSGWRMRVGRFHTSFKIPMVPDKSLDRNDASNFNLGWTDGIHLSGPVHDHWRAHLIGQFNSRHGNGNTTRQPLDFSDSGSRASVFAALEATNNPGPLIQRMLSLTWMPDSLATQGVASEQRSDYLTVTLKTAAAWPLGHAGTRLITAGEIGHAINRPERSAVGLSGNQEVSGNGFQVGLSVYDIRPNHHLGLAYGRAQAGWLISNDYRNNDELIELRYQYRFNPDLSMEIRYRWRRELELPADTDRPRRDKDAYARITLRF